MTQNQIAYWNMVYDNRHKERADAETARSNYAREVETNRTNVRNEAIKAADVFGNLELNQNKLYETQRHNLADEQIRSSSTLQGWVEMGLNPTWYTNGPVAIATGAAGLATLPTQQDVAEQNVEEAFSTASELHSSAKTLVQEGKPLVKQALKKAAKNVVSSAQDVANFYYRGTPRGIGEQMKQKRQSQKF